MNKSPIDSTAIQNTITELVRGQEHRFLEELKPQVLRASVCLNFSTVQRIDAAGLAALITLHCDARQAGHEFSISNPSHRVSEILSLVGLDKILVSPDLEKLPSVVEPLHASAA